MGRKMIDKELTIEKGIPIPPIRSGGRPKGAIAEAALKMQVGDSFYVEIRPQMVHGHLKSCVNAGMRFTTRSEKTGVRIWRLS
jgi:hypothetical protein